MKSPTNKWNQFLSVSLAGMILSIPQLTAENHQAPRPPKAPAKAVDAWHDAAFGVFIHWTPSVVFQGRHKGQEMEKDLWGEWLMKRANIPIKDYEAALKTWNPSGFNADEWTDFFVHSGFKYMVFIAKHHDGFAMFDSDTTDYNIVDHSGFQHDPYGELCAAALKRGIRPSFYYSHGSDWRNMKGGKTRRKSPNADAYFKKIVYPQLTKLCSYAKPFVIWFDLGAPQPYAGKCLEIVRMLATVRARGGNLLLNLGSDVRGRIPLRDQKILLQVGAWLKKNGNSIYGVKHTSYNDLPWEVCTAKPGQLFLHLLRWPSLDTLFLPGLKNEIESVRFLADPNRQPLSFKKVEGGYTIDLTSAQLTPSFLSSADTVVEVKYIGDLSMRSIPCLDQDLDNVFISHLARKSGGARGRQVRHTSMAQYGSSMTVFNDSFAYPPLYQ